MFSFRAVSHRLIFWILGASASLFLLISFYEYNTAQYFLREQIKTKAHLAKSDMVNRVNNLLHNVSENVRTTAGVLSVARPNNHNIEKLLKTVLSKHPDIYGMTVALEPRSGLLETQGFAPYYYRNNGQIHYVNLAAKKYNYRQQSWYKKTIATGQAHWSEPYFDQGGGNKAMVTYSAPIFIEEQGTKRLAGIVTADITLSSLANLVSTLAVGDNGFAYLFTRKGNIITHTNPKRVMANVSNYWSDSQHPNRLQDLLTDMLNGQQDTRLVGCFDKDNSPLCWLSYQPVNDDRWSIAIVIPMAEMTGSLDQYRSNSLLITISGLLLLTVIVIFLSRKLTTPLLALSQSTQQLARGDLDTDIPDFGLQDEVGSLARQFQQMQVSLKDYIAQLNQQAAQRERLEGELGAATIIQMQMLPDNGHSQIKAEHWQLSAILEPAKSVGGDLYHYQLLNDQQLFFAVGDVSDKGVAAALFMAKTQTLLRQLCQENLSLEQLLTAINIQLCHNNDSCMFVTMICGILDINTGQLTLASAGHANPLLYQQHCQTLELNTGPALGFFEDAIFVSDQYQLPLNCPLILTTDGADEATNMQQEFYGEERLVTVINQAHDYDNDVLLASIHQDILEFRSQADPSDDLTLMIITRT